MRPLIEIQDEINRLKEKNQKLIDSELMTTAAYIVRASTESAITCLEWALEGEYNKEAVAYKAEAEPCDWFSSWADCPICGHSTINTCYAYCMNCGSKMNWEGYRSINE